MSCRTIHKYDEKMVPQILTVIRKVIETPEGACALQNLCESEVDAGVDVKIERDNRISMLVNSGVVAVLCQTLDKLETSEKTDDMSLHEMKSSLCKGVLNLRASSIGPFYLTCVSCVSCACIVQGMRRLAWHAPTKGHTANR